MYKLYNIKDVYTYTIMWFNHIEKYKDFRMSNPEKRNKLKNKQNTTTNQRDHLWWSLWYIVVFWWSLWYIVVFWWSLWYIVQELLTLPENLSSPPVLSGIRVTRSLVLCVCFIDRCLSFFFWSLCCLFFFDIRILIAPLISSNSFYI
jgi:hypothetical protein